MDLRYRPFDADNHYYEALDSFTRYQPPAMKRRGVQILREGKRAFVVVADKISRFIPNPTFDPVIVPGSIELLFRGEVPAGVDPRTLPRIEPIHPEYQDRARRLEVMDKQGLAAVLLFPTLGVGIEQCLRHDPEATMACLSAFNRWLEEDWGYAYQDRIFAAPMLSLADPDAALLELRSLLDRGAKMVHVRPVPRALVAIRIVARAVCSSSLELGGSTQLDLHTRRSARGACVGFTLQLRVSRDA